MKDYVVWLDSKNAHIFELKDSGFEKSIVSKSTIDHHRRHKKDQRQDSHAEHYYRDLAAKLTDVDRLLLMGPGSAKNHFKDHLGTHKTNSLVKKIIGLERYESFEHRSEKQMIAKAHKFFEIYGTSKNPLGNEV